MPRFAVVDFGIVVGVLSAPAKPVVDIPVGRQFIDITEGPDIRGGEAFDNGYFYFVPDTTVLERLEAVEQAQLRILKDVDAIKTELPVKVDPIVITDPTVTPVDEK